ncbi:MAG: dehydratase, partial [Mycobacterium sp.]|nr:dehydratase [Mycobacterium sp.]
MSIIRAALGALPFVPRGDRLPDRVAEVSGLVIDRANVAAYASTTGLRYGAHVPITYPFVLVFPSAMALLTGFDFPFPAVGAVHV